MHLVLESVKVLGGTGGGAVWKKHKHAHARKMCPKTKKKEHNICKRGRKKSTSPRRNTGGVKMRPIVPGFKGIVVAARAHTSKGVKLRPFPQMMGATGARFAGPKAAAAHHLHQ